MKKSILLVLLIVTVVINSAAQNRSINFEETNEWQKVVKKAKKEKRLIFVDCYTSWCGPCTMLARNVFTNDSVADFFNRHFVNVKYDMEKDADASALKKQFGVRAYPTLLFVDPSSGKAIHRMTGAGSPRWLIREGQLAMEPENNLSNMMKRYAAGEREKAFLWDYASALYTAYMLDEAARVVCEYLEPLPVDSLILSENWYLINRYVTDPLCPLLKRVMAEREKFYVTIGNTKVDNKLSSSIYSAVEYLTQWHGKMKRAFDEKRNQELIDYLLNTDFVAAPAGLAMLYTAARVRAGDFRGMLEQVDKAISYNVFRNNTEVAYFRNNIKKLTGCGDDALAREGILRIDHFWDNVTNPFEKSNLLKVKASLQTIIGDTIGIKISTKGAERYYMEGLNGLSQEKKQKKI